MFNELVQQIQGIKLSADRPIVIAVSGFGGSGKSTLAEQLKLALGSTEIISIDAFIIGRLTQRSEDWEGFDRDRLQRQVLEPAHRGEKIRYEIYDWPQNTIVGWKDVPSSQYLIIEGCSILHPDLMQYYDFTIWIDCPLAEATKRGMERDRDWGADHDKLWQEVWQPNEQDFFNKYRPDRLATVIFKAT